MNVQQVVMVLEVVPRHLSRSPQKKLTNSPSVGEPMLLIQEAALQSMHMNAIDLFFSGLSFASQSKNVHVVAAPGKSRGIAQNAIVQFIEGV